MQLFFVLCNMVAFSPVIMLRQLAQDNPTSFVIPARKVLQMMNSTLANCTEAQIGEQGNFSECHQYCDSTGAEKNLAILEGKFHITPPNATISKKMAYAYAATAEMEISKRQAYAAGSEVELLTDDIGELSSQQAMLSRAIMDGKLQMAHLNAVISKATEDEMTLASEIQILTNDIEELSSQKAMLQEERGYDGARFIADRKDYMSAIDAVDLVLPVLASSTENSFTQVENILVELKSLQLESAALAVFINSRNGTKEQSPKDVLVTVKGLKKSFKDELSQLEKEEAQQNQLTKFVGQDLQNSIDQSIKERSGKMVIKAQRNQATVEAKANLLDATASVAADTEYLADLTKEFNAKAWTY